MPTDPRHPLRPDHPDFDRLSEVILELDAEAESAQVRDVGDIVATEADIASVSYMALQRAMRIDAYLFVHSRDIGKVELAAAWMEGLVAGIRFERKGRE